MDDLLKDLSRWRDGGFSDGSDGTSSSGTCLVVDLGAQACRCLHTDASGAKAFIKAGGLQLCLQLLRSHETEARTNGLSVLTSLAKLECRVEMLRDEACLPCLRALVALFPVLVCWTDDAAAPGFISDDFLDVARLACNALSAFMTLLTAGSFQGMGYAPAPHGSDADEDALGEALLQAALERPNLMRSLVGLTAAIEEVAASLLASVDTHTEQHCFKGLPLMILTRGMPSAQRRAVVEWAVKTFVLQSQQSADASRTICRNILQFVLLPIAAREVSRCPRQVNPCVAPCCVGDSSARCASKLFALLEPAPIPPGGAFFPSLLGALIKWPCCTRSAARLLILTCRNNTAAQAMLAGLRGPGSPPVSGLPKPDFTDDLLPRGRRDDVWTSPNEGHVYEHGAVRCYRAHGDSQRRH
jgi:hypothetical protein